VSALEKYLLICALFVAAVGAVNDICSRRIPNWLTYGGLVTALAVRCAEWGWAGLKTGFFGVLLAGGLFYILFLLGGMGGGDAKLMAAVGAWAGSAQALAILIAAAIAGGVLAIAYMVFNRRMLQTLRNTLELVRHLATSGPRPHPSLNIREPNSTRVPYGLAIALGTLYCAGNAFWWR
jgi:prepilin peptidase CpaA